MRASGSPWAGYRNAGRIALPRHQNPLGRTEHYALGHRCGSRTWSTVLVNLAPEGLTQHQNEIRTMETKHPEERRFRSLPHIKCGAIARIEGRRLGVYWPLAGYQNGNPGLTAQERRQGDPLRFLFPRQNPEGAKIK